MRSGIVSAIKRLVAPKGAKPRKVVAGLYKDLVLEIDLQSQTQLWLGLWERETYQYLRRYASYAWAVDVGAGGGELVLLIAAANPKAIVYAIEPNHLEALKMKRNARLNGLDDCERIRILRKFASSESSGGDHVRLDDLELPETGPGLLKVDVDGHEMEVLKGSRRLLQRSHVDVLVETHSLELEMRCIEFLRASGYEPEIISNALYRVLLPEQRPLTHNRWIWASRR